MTSQEIKLARDEVKASVKTWKSRNEGWENSESLAVVKKQVTDSTFKSYLTNLSVYLSWANTTPDEMISNRMKHLKSDDKSIRFFYEDSMTDFKAYLVAKHYKASSIKTMLSRVSGLFANHRLTLTMEPSFWKRSDKIASEVVESMVETRRYPDNDEVRAIIELANNVDRLAITLSYQTGLMPIDIVGLTWTQLNIDFNTEVRDFVYVENTRQKTHALHLIVLSPDALAGLKAEWIAQGEPTTGYVFQSRKNPGKPLQSQSIARRFKDYAVKATKNPYMFRHLRQSYNEAILDSEVSDEVKATLMGHVRKGSKASYSISSPSVVRIYKENIFDKLTVNGWLLKQQAQGYPELKNAINALERENAEYKTRIDSLQAQVIDVFDFVQAIMKANNMDSITVPVPDGFDKDKSPLKYKGA